MKANQFVRLYYPYAEASQNKTGLSALFTLAQAAHESGWGNAAPGNNFFGIKSFKVDDNKQLLRTTEFSKRNDLKFPEIISLTEVDRNGERWFKYVIRDWFRKYNTPEECFDDHYNFFVRNKRYRYALTVKRIPRDFARAIAEAGYATDPNYHKLLVSMIDMIEGIVNKT